VAGRCRAMARGRDGRNRGRIGQPGRGGLLPWLGQVSARALLALRSARMLVPSVLAYCWRMIFSREPVFTHSALKTRVNALVIKSGADFFGIMR
jgi:hypothetical protein